MKKLSLFVLISLSLTSCWKLLFPEKDGEFLNDVVALSDFNSEFDDYNSNLTSNNNGYFDLIFSSSRDKKDKFNLVHFVAKFNYDKRLDLKMIPPSENNFAYQNFQTFDWFVGRANGNFNVFGPSTIIPLQDLYQTTSQDKYLFYADDAAGNLDIKYTCQTKKGNQEPKSFDLLNSKYDDAYPTFTRLADKIYFCSNREGKFDIYEVSIPRDLSKQVSMESILSTENPKIRKVEELSGDFDNKCPYFVGSDKLVFVSNRPGGLGGFDLYYATLVDGKFSKPVNLGSRVNSANNEYRPIVPHLDNFNYDLMIFSSDRPGGKGGYDLYMTGLAY